jgi:lysozyme family protein
MADFDKAFRVTIIGNEGGYNPGIGEKETYMGIDRGANPAWPGWRIIDVYKLNNSGIRTPRLNMLLSQNLVLQTNIQKFYKTNYWNTVKLDNVTDQQLANNLFDCSVNQGEGLARRFMQEACNVVIEATKSIIRPLVLDHVIGAQTLGTFNALPLAELNTELNVLRLTSYKEDAGWAEWSEVWVKRLISYK